LLAQIQSIYIQQKIKMNESHAPSMSESTVISRDPVRGISPVVQASARWFWWIALVSLVNAMLAMSGAKPIFVMGLGLTTVLEGMLEVNKVTGFGITVAVLGLFAFLGLQGTRGKRWAFAVGIAIYTFDAFLYVLQDAWMPVAFHAVALFFIVRGALALVTRR
jgi:hypothetical protein